MRYLEILEIQMIYLILNFIHFKFQGLRFRGWYKKKVLGGLWSIMNNIKETSKWANYKTEKKSVFNLFTNLFIYTNNLIYFGRLIVLTLTDTC